jgi:hypothetical protein
MPTTKNTRKKYVPKMVLENPVSYVLEGFVPVREHKTHFQRIQIKNSYALTSLFKGKASNSDMSTLVAMSNIVEALCNLGFGAEHSSVAEDGRSAILSILSRSKYLPTGLEIKALQNLLDLHDAQLGVITVKELDKALEFVKRGVRRPDAIRIIKTEGVNSAG